jgi:hypothetical protein
MIRAPLAPYLRPIAIAPPLTLVLARSAPVSAAQSQVAGAFIMAIIVASSSGSEPA